MSPRITRSLLQLGVFVVVSIALQLSGTMAMRMWLVDMARMIVVMRAMTGIVRRMGVLVVVIMAVGVDVLVGVQHEAMPVLVTMGVAVRMGMCVTMADLFHRIGRSSLIFAHSIARQAIRGHSGRYATAEGCWIPALHHE